MDWASSWRTRLRTRGRPAGVGLDPYREIILLAGGILAAKVFAKIFLGREGHGLDRGRQRTCGQTRGCGHTQNAP